MIRVFSSTSVILAFVAASAMAQDDKPAVPANAEQLLLQQASADQKEALALAKTRQREAMAVADEIGEYLDSIAASHSTWEKDITVLLTNEDGKYLTAKPEYVKAFYAYYNTPLPKARESEQIRANLDTLIAPLKDALQDPQNTYLPSSNLTAELEKYRDRAQTMATSAEDPIKAVKTVLARAKTDGTKGTVTLETAVNDFAAASLVANSDEIAKQLQFAQEEAAKRIMKAQKDLIEENARLAETDAKQQAEITKQQSDMKAQAEMLRSPEVQKRLAPFITPGMSQITSGLMRPAKSGPAQPLSFSALNRIHALDDTDKGRQKLVEFATSKYNDRPTWSNPTTDEDWKEVAESQRILREMGPALIELKMLLP